VPSVSSDDVSILLFTGRSLQDYEMPIGIKYHIQEPIPWVPASKQHISNEQTPSAQLHVVKVVETGVINVRLENDQFHSRAQKD
jgi:hypothetical protein